MEYLIGYGGVLEAGEGGRITPAALHARLDPGLARGIAAAAVDFEGTSPESLRRLLVVGRGRDTAWFRSGVAEPLCSRGDCNLADVLAILASGAGTNVVHLFAHWLPGEQTCADLHRRGIEIVAHPLEAIHEASIVAGQRRRLWQAA